MVAYVADFVVWDFCCILAVFNCKHICKLQKLHKIMNERDRIELLMKCYELSPSQFADRTGIQRASVSHILSGRNKPSLEVMLKIYDAFPGIDMKWLMTGTGEEPVNDKSEIIQNTLFSDEKISKPHVEIVDSVMEPASERPTEQSRPVFQVQPSRQTQSRVLRKSAQGRQLQPQQSVQRRIKEVRIFYTDGTYETLLPEKQ